MDDLWANLKRGCLLGILGRLGGLSNESQAALLRIN